MHAGAVWGAEADVQCRRRRCAGAPRPRRSRGRGRRRGGGPTDGRTLGAGARGGWPWRSGKGGVRAEGQRGGTALGAALGCGLSFLFGCGPVDCVLPHTHCHGVYACGTPILVSSDHRVGWGAHGASLSCGFARGGGEPDALVGGFAPVPFFWSLCCACRCVPAPGVVPLLLLARRPSCRPAVIALPGANAVAVGGLSLAVTPG